MGTTLLISFAILMAIGLPIAVAMVGATLFSCLITGYYPTLAVTHKMISGVDSFVLIAIPFFILAGNIMNSGGITTRIFRFANTLVGRIPGGMGHANVVSSIIVSGMSGSAVADAGGLGSIIIRAMRNEGFDDDFSGAVTCASATIGPIIPPSIPLVVFGAMADVSIGSLFLGGLIPGLLLGITCMICVYIISVIRDYPVREKMNWREILDSFIEALPPNLTPVIILGGIFTGVCTPTEAAVLATFYSLFLSVIYREMTIKKLYHAILDTVIMSGSIIFIIAAAKAFSFIIAMEGIPNQLTAFLLSVTDNTYVVILLLNLILLLMGMFMEGLSILTITVPFLLPLIQQLGLNPVHVGVMVVLNLMIGLSTPPVGMSLFVVSKVANIRLHSLYKEIVPFLIPLLVVLLLIAIFPQIVTYLPSLAF